MSYNNIDEEIKVIFKIGVGEALAMIISWSLHKSVLWALIHGLFGWFYVVYYLLAK